MATVYSHSRLSSYENCPKQFHYRYVERRAVDSEGVEAFVGKRVHEVLERLNQFVGRGLVPSLAKVVGRFRAEWERHFDPARVRIVRAENPPEAYRENGERCLANHYRRHYPFDRDETLGIEAHVAFPLDDEGRYRLQGFVDRISRAPDGAIEIHDYKTGRWVPSQQQLDADRQLALYQIGVQARHGGDTPMRLVWHYLLRDQVRVSLRTPEQLADLRARTIELIDRIESEPDFAPTPSSLCTWCEHNDVCPAMQARSAANKPQPAPEAPAEEAACGGTALASAAAEGRGARSEPKASEAIRPPAHQQVRREEGLEGLPPDPSANPRAASGASANPREPSSVPANREAPIRSPARPAPPPPAPAQQLTLL